MRTPLVANRATTALTAERRLREIDRKAQLSQESAAAAAQIVGRNLRTSVPPTTAATTLATSQSVLSVVAAVSPGRLYLVQALHFGMYGSVAGIMQAQLTYTTDGSAPTPSSTQMDQVDVQCAATGTPEDASLARTFTTTDVATLTVLLSYFSPSAGTGHMYAAAIWPIELLITDLGIDPGLSGNIY